MPENDFLGFYERAYYLEGLGIIAGHLEYLVIKYVNVSSC